MVSNSKNLKKKYVISFNSPMLPKVDNLSHPSSTPSLLRHLGQLFRLGTHHMSIISDLMSGHMSCHFIFPFFEKCMTIRRKIFFNSIMQKFTVTGFLVYSHSQSELSDMSEMCYLSKLSLVNELSVLNELSWLCELSGLS